MRFYSTLLWASCVWRCVCVSVCVRCLESSDIYIYIYCSSVSCYNWVKLFTLRLLFCFLFISFAAVQCHLLLFFIFFLYKINKKRETRQTPIESWQSLISAVEILLASCLHLLMVFQLIVLQFSVCFPAGKLRAVSAYSLKLIQWDGDGAAGRPTATCRRRPARTKFSSCCCC